MRDLLPHYDEELARLRTRGADFANAFPKDCLAWLSELTSRQTLTLNA